MPLEGNPNPMWVLEVHTHSARETRCLCVIGMHNTHTHTIDTYL